MVLAVQRQPGTNTVAVAAAVKKLLPTFRDQLPASVSMNVLFDRSESIRASVNDVKATLLIALVLVVLVIFLFLRNLSATVIPSVALPLSLIGTFAVMYLLGYSLDNLSLMALTLSVGFVVDDAIVMLENIVRHMEAGERPLRGGRSGGAREIGFTILSMTLALTAVFIPVLFMGGIVGRLFHEFAVTIAAAILISGFVSLTLTPMLSSRFLRPSAQAHHGRIYAASERGFQGPARRLRGRAPVVAPPPPGHPPLLGDHPGPHRGPLPGHPQGVPAQRGHRPAHRLHLGPGVDLLRFHGGTPAGGGRGPGRRSQRALLHVQRRRGREPRDSNQGIAFIRLKPRSERKLDAEQVIQELRPKLAQVPGIQTFIQNPPPIRIGGTLSRSQYQFTLQAIDTEELYASAQALEARMQDLPGLQDVTSDLQIKNPQVEVEIDRDRAASLGVSAQQIESALQSAYASSQVSTIYAPSNEYAVIMELLPQYQRDPDALSRLYVRSASGDLVPLDALATLKEGFGPLSINHLGQLPAVTISFNLEPGVALGTAVGEVDRLARSVLPATVSTSFQGTAQAFQSSVKGLGILLLMAVLVIYLVLGILYESFIHPLTILSALPFAGFGALLTLLVFKTELSIYAFVGIILLVGLVKKNGIMMIDFALEAQRTEGQEPRRRHLRGLRDPVPADHDDHHGRPGGNPAHRHRASAPGAESRRPLGLAVVGGLLFSQFLTLFVTPVFFVYMDAFQRRLQTAFGREARRGERAGGEGGAAPARG